MAKMSISKAFSKRLRLQAASQRLRIIAEVVLGTFIGDSQLVSDSTSITDLFLLLLGKLFSDSVGTTDQAIFAIGKGAQETVDITETTAFDVSKPFSNAFSALDIASVGISKPQADTFTAIDAAFFNIGRNPQDLVSITESQIFDVSKGVIDQPIVTDVAGLSLSKTFADNVSMTDTIEALLLTLQEAADSGSVSDVNILTFGKQPQDTVITTESQAFAVTKGINDTVYVTDDIGAEATVDDDQTLQVQKRVINFTGITDAVVLTSEFYREFSDSGSITDAVVIEAAYSRPQSEAISASDVVDLTVSYLRTASDSAITQDSQTTSFDKVNSDIMGITDSGVLLSQDYVDNNLYFADDYVGEKRIF